MFSTVMYWTKYKQLPLQEVFQDSPSAMKPAERQTTMHLALRPMPHVSKGQLKLGGPLRHPDMSFVQEWTQPAWYIHVSVEDCVVWVLKDLLGLDVQSWPWSKRSYCATELD